MSSLKPLRHGPAATFPPPSEIAVRWLAVGLRCASAALARLSRRLARPIRREPRPVAQLEFYAESGAPEGALYLDGQLVGWVAGVRRLVRAFARPGTSSEVTGRPISTQ